jgi:hypothetical protein
MRDVIVFSVSAVASMPVYSAAGVPKGSFAPLLAILVLRVGHVAETERIGTRDD